MAGIQAAPIVALRIAKNKDLHWPLTLMAVLSAVLLAAGVLSHYYDIYTHRTVRGISFIFVGIDAAGDLFSLVSIFFQPKLDIQGMAIYGTELALWLGVFACGGYFNLVPWVKRRLKVKNSRRSEQEPEQAGNGEGVVLHNLPSSTSVFRTPSCEIGTLRSRPALESS
jgi:PQ loop repeat